jgi:hypothetical protein
MLRQDGRVVLMDFGAGGAMRHAGLSTQAHRCTWRLKLLPAGRRPCRAMSTASVCCCGTPSRVLTRPTPSPQPDHAALRDWLRCWRAPPPRHLTNDSSQRRPSRAALGPFARPPRVHPVMAFTGSTLVAVLIVLSGTALHEFWPAFGGRSMEAPAKGLTLRPLWTKQLSDGLDMFGPPEHTGKVDSAHRGWRPRRPRGHRPRRDETGTGSRRCQRWPERLRADVPARAGTFRTCSGVLVSSGRRLVRTQDNEPRAWPRRTTSIACRCSHPAAGVVVRGQPRDRTQRRNQLRSWNRESGLGYVEWVSPPRPGFGRASLSPDARWLAFDGSSNPTRREWRCT